MRNPVSSCLLAALMVLTVPPGSAAGTQPFERTEQREPCAAYAPLRQPLYGDLHVHTRLSQDAYLSSQRNGPDEAYAHARGKDITVPDADGEQTISARLRRPLDFTAVTDHSEFLGALSICTTDPWKLGYWAPHCILTRSQNFYAQLLAVGWWSTLKGEDTETPLVCRLSDCTSAALSAWMLVQEAAERHYDRSSNCAFTTFVGYEYSNAPDFRNLHRNVIFRNDKVTLAPISTYDTGLGPDNVPRLWDMLGKQCLDAGTGCDVLAIPHNSNLSGGLMFIDPASPQEARDRLRYEPLVELTQHKGSSECRFDRLAGVGAGTTDELCDFEQLATDNLSMLGSVHGKQRSSRADPVPIDAFAPRNMVRTALKDGLRLGQQSGINPFMPGFIGSTDTHSATPGSVDEDRFGGHLGRRDVGYRGLQDHFFDNPGGLAVVWAEENSRDAIFAAMRRRETYATSGTRPTVRFFAGSDLEPGLCDDPQLLAKGYAQGVPMGGEIRSAGKTTRMRVLVSAQKDTGTSDAPGNDLQRIQIVKGWVDAEGQTHEEVLDVAGSAHNGAGVDTRDCTPTGLGSAALCSVWEDPDFDPARPAFYYARVLENPSCRWTTHRCMASGVNPFAEDCSAQADAADRLAHAAGASGPVYGNCCLNRAEQAFYSPVIQERAWTSPVWYLPPAP
jgi:hypothetical protein